MNEKREFYLIGFFKDMSNEAKVVTVLILCVFFLLMATIANNHFKSVNKESKYSTAVTCEDKAFVSNLDSYEMERVLLACKGVVTKKTCKEYVINSELTTRLTESDTIEKLLYACEADKDQALKRLKTLK